MLGGEFLWLILGLAVIVADLGLVFWLLFWWFALVCGLVCW